MPHPSKAPVVFCDTETTSLTTPWRPDGRRIWEATLKRVDPAGDVVHHRTYLVLDVDVENADPVSLHVGEFHTRHPRHDGTVSPGVVVCSEADLAREVAQVCVGVHLCSANPTFEHEGFAELLYRHGFGDAVPWHHHLIDINALAAAATRTPPPWSSGTLSAAVGVDRAAFGPAHTSAADTDWHEAVYAAVMGGGHG